MQKSKLGGSQVRISKTSQIIKNAQKFQKNHKILKNPKIFLFKINKNWNSNFAKISLKVGLKYQVVNIQCTQSQN